MAQTRIMYDVIVVGAGMIGSAAARHLAESTGMKVLLIGPEEPEDRRETDTFGAHHDEGRITRTLGPDAIWAKLAVDSIARYKDIENRSGIKFYTEVGYVAAGSKSNPILDKIQLVANKANVPMDTYSSIEFSKKMPFLKFPDHYKCMYIDSDGGYISPRKLVKAQKLLAAKSGCEIVADIVQHITILKEPTECVSVVTDTHRVFQSKRVLIASGAFTSCRNLLPRNRLPNLQILGKTITLLRITESEARRLADMPSFVDYHEEEARKCEYVLPPIIYPNGHYYLKIGTTISEELRTSQEISQWQQGYGDVAIGTRLHRELLAYLPGLKIEGVEMDSCMTAVTEHGYPYIDMVTDRVGVAVGGCGAAAKSSDEMGRIAALMVANGSWPVDDIPVPRDNFLCKYVEKDCNNKSQL